MSLPDCGTAFERVRQGAGDVDLAGQNGAVASAPLGEAGRTSTTGSALHSAGGIGGLLAVCDLNDTPGAEQTGDDLQYIYAYDGNGNVVQVLDWSASSATAAIVAKYEYDPYGNVVAQAGDYAERNPFRFSTKQWDDETGFGYWGYRYYSSRLGRWLTRDPLEEFGGLNLYVYSQSNPASLIDPLGDRTLSYEINVAVPGTGFSAYGRAELGQDGCCFDFDVFLAAEWNPPGIKAIDAVAYRVTGLHVEAGVRGGMKAGVKYCCNQGCLADTKICGRFEGFVRLEHRVRYAKDWGGRKRFTRERFGVGGDLDLELCLSTCSGDVTVNGAVSIWAYAHFGWSWLNRSYDFAQSWSFFDTKLGNCGVAPLRKYCCN